MIDYESYNTIINYLNKKRYKDLRGYIKLEIEKYYLKNARGALSEYLKESGLKLKYCDYLDDNKIILTDSDSVYILNSDEILTDYYKKNLKSQIDYSKQNIILQNHLKQFEDNSPYLVKEFISISYKNLYEIHSDNNEVIQLFNKKAFYYSNNFLGDNITYYLNDGQIPACIAKSSKGKGLILGVKK